MNKIDDPKMECYMVSKKKIDNLIIRLKMSRDVYKSISPEGREWKVIDSTLSELQPIVERNKGVKEIDLDY